MSDFGSDIYDRAEALSREVDDLREQLARLEKAR